MFKFDTTSPSGEQERHVGVTNPCPQCLNRCNKSLASLPRCLLKMEQSEYVLGVWTVLKYESLWWKNWMCSTTREDMSVCSAKDGVCYHFQSLPRLMQDSEGETWRQHAICPDGTQCQWLFALPLCKPSADSRSEPDSWSLLTSALLSV